MPKRQVATGETLRERITVEMRHNPRPQPVTVTTTFPFLWPRST